MSESGAAPGFDGHDIAVRISSSGSERRDFPVRIRVTSPLSASVEATNVQFDSDFDVLFGTRLKRDDPITYNLNIEKGVFSSEITAFVRQDFVPEPQECFTLIISGLDSSGYRDISSCNDDSTDSTDYFCQHTICIQDDDG